MLMRILLCVVLRLREGEGGVMHDAAVYALIGQNVSCEVWCVGVT